MAVSLILDVDGALCPYSSRSAWDDWVEVPGAAFELFVSRAVADTFAALPVELVWLTTWFGHANTVIAPALGWSTLPVLARPTPSSPSSWWKLDSLRAHLATTDNAVVWVDDELDKHPSAARALRDDPHRHLLVCPDRATGISPADLDAIVAFVTTNEP